MPFHGRSRPSPADQKQDKTSKRVLGSVFALDHLSKVTPSDTHVPCPWASDEPQTAGHTRAGKRPQGKGTFASTPHASDRKNHVPRNREINRAFPEETQSWETRGPGFRRPPGLVPCVFKPRCLKHGSLTSGCLGTVPWLLTVCSVLMRTRSVHDTPSSPRPRSNLR